MKTILTSSCFTLLTLLAKCSFLKQTLHNIFFPELKFCEASDRLQMERAYFDITFDYWCVLIWYGRLRGPGGRMWNTSDLILRCDRETLHLEGLCGGARPGQKVCRSLLTISSLSAATVTKLRMWSHRKRFVGTSGFLKISFPLHHDRPSTEQGVIITNLFQRFYCLYGNNAVFSSVDTKMSRRGKTMTMRVPRVWRKRVSELPTQNHNTGHDQRLWVARCDVWPRDHGDPGSVCIVRHHCQLSPCLTLSLYSAAAWTLATRRSPQIHPR